MGLASKPSSRSRRRRRWSGVDRGPCARPVERGVERRRERAGGEDAVAGDDELAGELEHLVHPAVDVDQRGRGHARDPSTCTGSWRCGVEGSGAGPAVAIVEPDDVVELKVRPVYSGMLVNRGLYLAVHGQDRIVTIDKKGKAKVVAQGGPLQQPSSLVFGATKKSEKTLYIANFSILAALGVKPGPPTPAVLTLPVKQKGLSLP